MKQYKIEVGPFLDSKSSVLTTQNCQWIVLVIALICQLSLQGIVAFQKGVLFYFVSKSIYLNLFSFASIYFTQLFMQKINLMNFSISIKDATIHSMLILLFLPILETSVFLLIACSIGATVTTTILSQVLSFPIISIAPLAHLLFYHVSFLFHLDLPSFQLFSPILFDTTLFHESLIWMIGFVYLVLFFYLWSRKVIKWRIVVSAMLVLFCYHNLFSSATSFLSDLWLSQLLLLTMFFVADVISSPATSFGQYTYGLLFGLIFLMIQKHSFSFLDPLIVSLLCLSCSTFFLDYLGLRFRLLARKQRIPIAGVMVLVGFVSTFFL